ncbi:MAG: phospholipid-binding protein MlaC [Rhodothalassiaceae bacterium]
MRKHVFVARPADGVAVLRRLFGLAALLLAFLSGLVAPAAGQEASEDPEAAKAFISKLADEAMAIWRDPTITFEQREQNFRDILQRDFAIDFLARLSLGRYLRTATKEQLKEYFELFPVYVVDKFARRLGDYNNQTIEIGGTAPAGSRDIFVRTTLIRPGGEPIAADWRVRKIGDGFKIVDVKVEGISMAITQRDEFASIIAREGFDGLLDVLRKGGGAEDAGTAAATN